MIVREFRFLTTDDEHEEKRWDNWSRCYEYTLVLRKLAARQAARGNKLRVHNTACGGSPLHTAFANELHRLYDTVNSDMEPLKLAKYPKWPWVPNYAQYDLTQPDEALYGGVFDAVLCISTLEHIESLHTELIVRSLLDQLRPSGILMITADVPSKCMAVLTQMIGFSCGTVDAGRLLTPDNSAFFVPGHPPTNIVYLEAQP